MRVLILCGAWIVMSLGVVYIWLVRHNAKQARFSESCSKCQQASQKNCSRCEIAIEMASA